MEAYLRLDGAYTRITNSLLTALYKCSFNGTELRLILAVIRRTYGWNRETAFISYGCLASELEVDKRNIRRTVKSLVQDKVIFKNKFNRTNLLSVNKDYTSWSLWKTQEARNENTPCYGMDRGEAAPKKRGEGVPTVKTKYINK